MNEGKREAREANRFILHASDAYGHAACGNGDGELAPVPEQITCGQAACMEVRSCAAERKRNQLARDPSLAPPARQYALAAYAKLESELCPGGEGHEGRGGRDYCAACIINAIESAWNDGHER